ncbi:MAG: glycosyltransferase family 2 protein [bacterium]|nr:glycosyltransferase family 2 protein [bacterium]
MTDAPELSLVVPAFNEEESIDVLYRKLDECVTPAVESFELILIDDGSRDETWTMICRLSASDSRVRGIRLARNFGHQIAISAGIDAVRGQAAVILDADLQDPPEVIPELVEKWREGYQVVYAQRGVREGETWFKKVSAAAWYRLLRKMTNMDVPVDTGDFRLLGPQALEALRAIPEKNRYIRGLVTWLGFPQCAVVFRRKPRHAGVTKYPLKRLLGLAWDGMASFSYVPLRVATWSGLVAVGLALAYGVLLLGLQLLASAPEWFSPVLAVVLFMGGVQLIAVGILGEYLGRIYDEVKDRPLYFIRERVGSEETSVLPPT